MFPLGTVLFPSMVLPLHVFEPRYRQLTLECIEAEREFGVVLIARGSEVGGGDQRRSVGTLARIVQAGLVKVNRPDEEVQAAMDEAALREIPRIAKRTGFLALLANLSMLSGLLGTVSGLITSFGAVSGESVST